MPPEKAPPKVHQLVVCPIGELTTAFGPREVIAQGNKAAAFGWFRLRALASGRTVDVPYSIFVELRNGLIAKYHFLENTFDVAATFRTSGSWQMHTDGVTHDVPATATSTREQ